MLRSTGTEGRASASAGAVWLFRDRALPSDATKALLVAHFWGDFLGVALSSLALGFEDALFDWLLLLSKGRSRRASAACVACFLLNDACVLDALNLLPMSCFCGVVLRVPLSPFALGCEEEFLN